MQDAAAISPHLSLPGVSIETRRLQPRNIFAGEQHLTGAKGARV